MLSNRILEKLRMESDNKKSTGGKGTVDTHRGGMLVYGRCIVLVANDYYRLDNYQFCYFLRKTEPHSVIMKVYQV